MEPQGIKRLKDEPQVQLPFRCAEELRSRIHRALGREMTRTGEKISVNEFMKRLVEEGLKSVGG